MKDGMTLDRTSYQGETIGVELPVTVDLVVATTEPGFAGDTQTGARKPATTETGLVVTVPIFVERATRSAWTRARGVPEPGLIRRRPAASRSGWRARVGFSPHSVRSWACGLEALLRGLTRPGRYRRQIPPASDRNLLR
jgi:hypothetical protein